MSRLFRPLPGDAVATLRASPAGRRVATRGKRWTALGVALAALTVLLGIWLAIVTAVTFGLMSFVHR